MIEGVVLDSAIKFSFPEIGKCPSPYISLEKGTFGYDPETPILKDVTLTIDD
jgi:ABC-type multidrug transport system fused ATPase/permease subunit